MQLLTRYWAIWLSSSQSPDSSSRPGLGGDPALSLAALGYFLFQAPMWCGAETRTGD